ncbi:helix-turn-helix domain-containing protein [Spongiactinospora sp. TRM90649]|uniref:helix-turn-helix domain-containing protein n=1 Tax=Spongiactinospora sp. TRM90649 TaxID=3031114 RepID=UPI0023F927AA|nr:helix-turn-helix domain-containing protein [Spongiactinospora sp. TRM90649]MDF5755689.1 helix-turn-helix domain-containing protein [Spongiactinospora sp. TRM90649]
MSQDLVGQRIKTIRRQRGLSQAQLAHPELSDSYVSLIESGKRTPTPAVLDLLARKLDCSLSYLVNGVTAEQMQELELELGYARIALENGEVSEARRRYADLVADNNVAGLLTVRIDAEFGLARAMEAGGDLDSAIATLNGLRASAGDGMSPERHIAVAIALSRCYRERGDFAAAVQICEQILMGPVRPAWTDDLVELGATLLAAYDLRGDLLRAQQFCAELIAAADLLGSPRATVAACWNGALLAEVVGRKEEALTLATRALAVHAEIGDQHNLARVRLAYTWLRLRLRPEEAEDCRAALLHSQRELAESSASVADQARCELELAHVELALGNFSRAIHHAVAAHDLVSSATNGLGADAQLLLAAAYAMADRRVEARTAIDAAKRWLEQVTPARRAAQGWRTVAEVLGKLNDGPGSVAAYQRALTSVGL